MGSCITKDSCETNRNLHPTIGRIVSTTATINIKDSDIIRPQNKNTNKNVNIR